MHSATKASAGHNDATLGVVAGSQELLDWLWSFAVLQGANASPFDAMNGLRGLRTLAVRFRQQTETALRLGEVLEAHDAVAGVIYPGLDSHPQRELAKRQMKLTGGRARLRRREAGSRAADGSSSRCSSRSSPRRSVVPRRS